jgi:hypothetical protein
MADNLADTKRCDTLLDAYSHAKSGVELRAGFDYVVLRNTIAEGIASSECSDLSGDSEKEIREFAQRSPRKPYMPGPEYITPIDRRQWRFVSWAASRGVTRYQLSLNDVAKIPEYDSIVIEISSPNWPIQYPWAGVPKGSVVRTKQQHRLLSMEPNFHSFLFPSFDSSLGWYITIDVVTKTRGPEFPEFSTRVGFVRFP